jgi:NAD(P)-dependent dehydrogenase (short-subunit alcohol dehydrogenase family)
MNDLTGKVAIVTGASRGIGAAAAFVLAKAGAAVMLVARDGNRASHLAEEIVASGGRARALACDVSHYGSVQTMVDETDQRLGSIDILVNNAGIIEPIGTLVQSDPAAWARSIEVNLVGAYHAARATLPRMLEAGKGTVINISSGAAHRPLEGWSAYCSAKAGLAMLTNAIALECADAGVRVFGLAPGSSTLICRPPSGHPGSTGSARYARSIWRRWGTPRQRSFIFAPLPPMTSSAKSSR